MAVCGRFVAATSPADWAEELAATPVQEAWQGPDFNVCPGKHVLIAMASMLDGQVTLVMARALWGLIPSWAKHRAISSKLTNARIETVADKPSFRAAYARRRCLVLADGYYEWYAPQQGPKQPFYIRPADGSVIAMAGLYEWWADPAGGGRGEPQLTCTILTQAASPELAPIHDRMPVMIDASERSRWLDPQVAGRDIDSSVLGWQPVLDAVPVGAAVGNVRNNGSDLIAALPAAQALF